MFITDDDGRCMTVEEAYKHCVKVSKVCEGELVDQKVMKVLLIDTNVTILAILTNEESNNTVRED